MAAPTADAPANVLSILSVEEARELGGIPNEAIVGIFVGESTSPAAFRPNPRFLPFLHRVLALEGGNDPALVAAAASQGTGWVYLIDARTPDGPQGNVPPEDIIGGFKVAEGKLVDNGYQANDQYRAFTGSGIIQLPSGLRGKLLAVLRDLVQRRRSAEPRQ